MKFDLSIDFNSQSQLFVKHVSSRIHIKDFLLWFKIIGGLTN
jgi:hypothetical protein